MHDYQLSQTYLQRAKAAGAPDAKVRIGLANNYLAMGDTVRAHAELSAVRTAADSAPDYQYLLGRGKCLSPATQRAQALTSFAQASNAGGEDRTAERDLLQAGADEGLRVTPVVSCPLRFLRGTYLRRYDCLCSGLQAGCPISGAEFRYRSSSTAAFFPRDTMDQRIPSSS